MSSRKVTLTTTFLVLAAGGLAACDLTSEEDYEDGHFYCADSQGNVVAEEYCDDKDESYNPSNVFIFMGSSVHTPPAGYSSYPVGSKLPANSLKIPVTDSAARSRVGLAPSGRVTNGTVKTGVVGKGGSGSSVSGGKGGAGGKSGGG